MSVQWGVDALCGPCRGTGVSHERKCLKCDGAGVLRGPVAVARRDDREASKAAAASLSSEAITAAQKHVLEILKHYGPQTDEDILRFNHAGFMDYGRLSPSGARTRRCELERKGLVYDTGRRVRTKTGRMHTVWAAR